MIDTRQPELITASVVARMTGFSSGLAFLKARSRLELQQGFPEPLPTCLRPMKWRRSAIQAWLDGLDTIRTTAAASPNVVLLEQARSA